MATKGNTADRELVITRILNAPRELVFEAWVNPNHIIHWWGPDGFTNTIHKMEVKPGGVWSFIMHGPDGVNYPNQIVYEEVVKPSLLVYRHGTGEDNDPRQFHVTVSFETEGKKTRLTMRSVFTSAEALEAVKKFGAVEGGQQTLNHLEAYLSEHLIN